MRGNPFADVRIETQRLLLRPFAESDATVFADIATRDEVLEFLPSTDRMTRKQLGDVFAWLLECYETNMPDRIRKFTLPMVLKETGEIIGWCGLGPLDYDDSETEVYFVTAPEHWGEGLATEGAGALLEYAFRVLRLTRVVAVVDPRNHASVRVVENLGMRLEGEVEAPGSEQCEYGGHLQYSIEAGEMQR